MTLRVKNWKEFQHYKERRPPWIKLHRSLLDDPEFYSLPVASRAIAPCIWLLASESVDGSISSDPAKLAFRLHCTSREVIAHVIPLIDKGFLEGSLNASATLSARKQVTRPEESRGETENNGNGSKNMTAALADQRTESQMAIERFNVAFRRAFNRPRAALPPDKAGVFAERLASGYAVEFLVGCPVACRAAGLDNGRVVQPEYLLRNGSGRYTRGGETRQQFDWLGALWQSADRLKLTPPQAEILRGVEALDWWAAKGATVLTPERDEC